MLFTRFFVVFFCVCAILPHAQYGPYYVTVLYMQNSRRLPGLFVLNERHQAVCTVLL